MTEPRVEAGDRALETARKQFEDWANKQKWAEDEPPETSRDDLGRYNYSDVEYGWKAWQACAERAESAMNAHDKARLGTDWQELAEKNQETADKALVLVEAMIPQERELREALKDALYVMNSRPQQGWDRWRNTVAEAERLLAERGGAI